MSGRGGRSHAHVCDWFGAVVLVVAVLAWGGPAWAFETNGRHWDEMPVKYWINPAECPTLADGSTIIEIVDEEEVEVHQEWLEFDVFVKGRTSKGLKTTFGVRLKEKAREDSWGS